MSSQSITSEQSSKKRKHDGDSQEVRTKKRKNEVAASEEDDIAAAKAAKKEKKKRDRTNEESQKGSVLAASQGDTVETTSTTEKKKKKKKSREQEVASQSALEDSTTLVNSRTDTTMVDEPMLGNGHAQSEVEMIADDDQDEVVSDQLQSTSKSSFQAIRMSLYLPIPAIASSSILSALLTVHISPLLLTFFPPAGGVVLSYHDPVLSAVPQPGAGRPSLPPNQAFAENSESEVYSTVGEEFGASWVWLTITLLVFKPETGSELTGFTNVMSEGFIGLVSYNYFQASIPRNRIPKDWSWSGPSRQRPKHKMVARKGVLNDSDEFSQETLVDSQELVREDDAADGIAGAFIDADGNHVPEDLKFRVVDLEMIQAQERGRQFALQLEGTLLDGEAERQLREEEKLKWEARKTKHKSRSRTPGTPMMSGGLPTHSRAGSVISVS